MEMQFICLMLVGIGMAGCFSKKGIHETSSEDSLEEKAICNVKIFGGLCRPKYQFGDDGCPTNVICKKNGLFWSWGNSLDCEEDEICAARRRTERCCRDVRGRNCCMKALPKPSAEAVTSTTTPSPTDTSMSPSESPTPPGN